MSKHINLQLGWPAASLFPAAQLLDGASAVLQTPEKAARALEYGPDAGYAPLCHSIAEWLASVYAPDGSVAPDPERICVTNGASGALSIILAKFTDPAHTRHVWMVEPCYFLACAIFADAGFQDHMRGVPEDDEGLDIEFLRQRLQQVESQAPAGAVTAKSGARYPKLYRHVIYAVPTFSNPSGKVMSYRRRAELVRLAREFDALVVTDDVYDVLRWPAGDDDSDGDGDGGAPAQLGPPPPQIVDLDRALDGGPRDAWGNAASNGSFSKIVAPGVRTGWVEAAPALALALSQAGATRSGGCPSQLAASLIHEMLATGRLQRHLRDTLARAYRAKSRALLRAVRERLVPLGFEVVAGRPYEGRDGAAAAVAGGYFVYFNVPPDVPGGAAALASQALEKHNLRVAFGDMMTVEGDPDSARRASASFGRGIRLCWAWHAEEELLEGVARLESVVQQIRSKGVA